jgi:transcriptional regulator with XRE-family HTH domain
MTQPTREEIAAARAAAGLTQAEAARLVHLGAPGRWSEYESGVRNIDMARWELFRLKVWLRARRIKIPW